MNYETDHKKVVFVVDLPRKKYQTVLRLMSEHGDYQSLLKVAAVVRDRAQEDLDKNRELLSKIAAEIEESRHFPDAMYQRDDEVKGPQDKVEHRVPPRDLVHYKESVNDISNVVYLPRSRNNL